MTRPFCACSGKKSLHTGVRTGLHYLIFLSVCLSVRFGICVRFVNFTDCESCTRPISTNPSFMELTRGSCFVACRLEVVAVVGLLLISWFESGEIWCF